MPNIEKQITQSCISRSQMVAGPTSTKCSNDYTDTEEGEVMLEHPAHFIHQTSDPTKNTQQPVKLPNRSISSPAKRFGRGRSGSISSPAKSGGQGCGGRGRGRGWGSPKVGQSQITAKGAIDKSYSPKQSKTAANKSIQGYSKPAPTSTTPQMQTVPSQVPAAPKQTPPQARLNPPTKAQAQTVHSQVPNAPKQTPPQARLNPPIKAQTQTVHSQVPTAPKKTPPQARSNPPIKAQTQTVHSQVPTASKQAPPQARSNASSYSTNTQNMFGASPLISKLTEKTEVLKQEEKSQYDKKPSKYTQEEEYGSVGQNLIRSKTAPVNVPLSNPPLTNTTLHAPLYGDPPPPAALGPGNQTVQTEEQSYETGQNFPQGQEEASLSSNDNSLTSGSHQPFSNTESTLDSREQETLSSDVHVEQENPPKLPYIGSSAVASVQSKSGKACFVLCRDNKPPCTLEHSSLVSTAIPVANDDDSSLVYQGKVRQERRVIRPVSSLTSDLEQVSLANPDHNDDQLSTENPQLLVRDPESMAASSQSADKAKGGSLGTMDLVKEDESGDEVHLKPSHFENPPPQDVLQPSNYEDDDISVNYVTHSEPKSTVSTGPIESLSEKMDDSFFTPSDVGGSTQKSQPTPSLPPADGSPQQPSEHSTLPELLTGLLSHLEEAQDGMCSECVYSYIHVCMQFNVRRLVRTLEGSLNSHNFCLECLILKILGFSESSK